MNAFLFMLAETHEHMKIGHKRELIKVYASAAEIFEEALIPFMPKIQGYLDKKLREGDPQLHVAIAESMGSLVQFLFGKVSELEELIKNFNPVLKGVFVNLASPNKNL